MSMKLNPPTLSDMNISHIFDFFDTPKTPTNTVVTQGYEPVVVDDWEAVSAINPTPDGPWIAGGATLAWFKGHAVGESDIDVFCRDVQQKDELEQRLIGFGAQATFRSNNAVTFTYSSKNGGMDAQTWKIQLITREYYNSLEEVIDAFDISVCQIGTDGIQFVFGDQTLEDINSRVLRMSDPPRAGALKRYCKYVAYGYRPTVGLHESIVDNPNTTWEFEGSEDYDDF